VIQEIGRKRCRKTPGIINKGVPVPNLSTGKDFLDRLEASPGRYILAVSRFVAEKGLDLLLTALQAQRPAWKLVIAGDAVHHTNYSRELKALIDADDTIIRTGHITGERLNQVFTHAGLFVLPSYHEGLPIALLEALSYGLSVLVSDIPANKEVDLSAECFFNSGDMADLREKPQSAGDGNFRRRKIRLSVAVGGKI
jgi:glycosyltransferase involved in cell wall biosynthesis